MSILSTEQLGHSFNDRWLFRSLHFGLQQGSRVALVGINGTGKSSLLKILAGKLIPTEGRVVSERGLKIGYLDQDPQFAGLKTVNDFIYSAENEQQQLIRQYEELLEQENPSEKLLQELTDKLSELNAWEYEYEIKTILSRLGIQQLTHEIEKLSGGQRKRLALAKLLIDEPDVYILDEPTNHLDIETIEWLEKLLTTGQKTVLLVTHDRYFLDNICNEIREIDRGNLYTYQGKYEYFLEKKSEREATESVMAERARNLLRRELEWMRRQPQARGTKSKARIDAYYDLEERSKGKQDQGQVNLSMKIARQGNKIIELTQIGKRFGNINCIENFSYTFKKGDRIGLAGRNGTGKSTFLNLLTGISSPDHGTIQIGETTVFGYYKQGGLPIKDTDRVIDVVKEVAEYIAMANGETITASQLLTHFLFPPEKQFGMVSKLSGGERKRLQLMRVLMTNPNFLILDEPANDLDIDTLNVLEDFLLQYTGVLMLVSHDRYLLDRLTDQLFIFEGEGSVKIYNGNYADYKNELEAEQKERKKIEIASATLTPKEKIVSKSKLAYKEQKELELLNHEIPLLEKEIMEKQAIMHQTTDPNQLIALSNECTSLTTLLDDKSTRWLELSEMAEV
ncbi:ATP-binding cassette, subfamily F, uup [bacterium A37T11]|nr:ATP-binding cassette, subfamily F, uup [bacterium A37T11]